MPTQAYEQGPPKQQVFPNESLVLRFGFVLLDFAESVCNAAIAGSVIYYFSFSGVEPNLYSVWLVVGIFCSDVTTSVVELGRCLEFYMFVA